MTFWVSTLTDYVHHCRDDSSCRRHVPSSCSCQKMRCALDDPELGSHNMFMGMRAEWIRKLSPGGPPWVSYFWVFPRLSPPAPPLIEKHEKESKQAKGAGDRANSAAAVDTAAASMGSVGLLAFALIGSTSLRVVLRRYSCARGSQARKEMLGYGGKDELLHVTTSL
jgi:hypothetical protein